MNTLLKMQIKAPKNATPRLTGKHEIWSQWDYYAVIANRIRKKFKDQNNFWKKEIARKASIEKRKETGEKSHRVYRWKIGEIKE